MFALSLHDLAQGILTVDLIDILRLAQPKVLASTWTACNVYATGPCAAELEAISGSGARLGGDSLLRLAERIDQVIDGDFQGTLPDEASAWLVIRAMDSSCYVVITADRDLCSLIEHRYRDARDAPLELAFIE